MATVQYHEPAEDMDKENRDFARVIASMIEEAEAINWYQQRLSVTEDGEVQRILRHAQKEEMEHFTIALEWLARKFPTWQDILKSILFKEGDIVENAEVWERTHED